MTAPLFYRSSEVAQRLRVTTRTVRRWSNDGKLPYIFTPGGHRRYSAQLVDTITETVMNTTDDTVVNAVMAAGHYSQPADVAASHDIRFNATLAFAGPSPAQYAYLRARCGTCNTARDVGTDRSLADLIRWYAQHAGRPAAEHAVLTALAAISPTGADK